ncbi:MAG: hypothetical protein ORN51_06105 [Akkermansiaceae bacterium]|nr:hypothetical protein [Akkermansiaceae bacterium]
MQLGHFAIIAAVLVVPLRGEIKRVERKSLLDSDPTVVYLDQTLKKSIDLQVVKDAPVFSDKEGKQRLGILKGNQTVRLEAITDKIYRVRGQGTRDGIAGWAAPWAFSSTDPEFVAHLKSLYDRQIQIQNLIAKNQVAIGMTLEEVTLSKGKPTKTTTRKTATGESGRWDFIEYEDVKNYVTEVDRATGNTYRRLVSVTRVEKSKSFVEFENDVVTALEESEDHQAAKSRIVVPPLIFQW